jgi:hypothetical protein
MTRDSIDDFFNGYAAAFSHGNAEQISRLWNLPAFISAPQRSSCVSDAQAFEKNTEALCAF